MRRLRLGRSIGTALVVLSASVPLLPGAAQAATNPTLGLRTINYKPFASGEVWGSNFSASQLTSDFQLAVGLHANDIRVFVGTNDTGPVKSYPAITSEFRSQLASLLSIAHSVGLTVQLSIFSQQLGFPTSGSGLNNDRIWMANVLSGLANSPYLSGIDFRNELPNPGDGTTQCGSSNADPETWASALLPSLRSDIGSLPVFMSMQTKPAASSGSLSFLESLQAKRNKAKSTGTKSTGTKPATRSASLPLFTPVQTTPTAGNTVCSSPANLVRFNAALTNKPDAYGWHFYGVPSVLAGQLADLSARSSQLSGVPIFVQETGYSTDTSNTGAGTAKLAATAAVRNAYQAYYYLMAAKAAQAAGLGAPAPWELVDDMTESGNEVSFGLYAVNQFTGARTAKPAARAVSSVFSNFASNTTIPVPSSNPAFDDANNGAPGNLPSPWLNNGLTAMMNGNFVTPKSSPYDACGDRGNSASYFSEWLPTVEPLTQGSYTASVYVNGGSNRTRIGLQWFDDMANAVSTEATSSLSGPTNGWRALSVTSSPPAGAVTGKIVLWTQANACFDNLSVPLGQT